MITNNTSQTTQSNEQTFRCEGEWLEWMDQFQNQSLRVIKVPKNRFRSEGEWLEWTESLAESAS